MISTKISWFNRRWIFLSIFFLCLCSYAGYYHSITQVSQPFIPRDYFRSLYKKSKSPYGKISISHYTTIYGTRIDAKSKIFDGPLSQICEIIDPEDYRVADSVYASLVDFAHFPTINRSRKAYRQVYSSQLWVMYSEESPRNSYRTVQMKSITDLDDWFNFTSTLKPESDFPIQYKGYRIKPEIANLLRDKLRYDLKRSLNSSYISSLQTFVNSSSIYLNNLTTIFNDEIIRRENYLTQTCPFGCNQPLSPRLVRLLQPYLKSYETSSVNRNMVHIVWFVSNCDSHSGREEYVRRLRSQPGIHVDIYGGCSSIFHRHIVPIQCKKGTPGCLEKTLKHYRFYLSFENSKCDSYITEKYWFQGMAGVIVPIVLGAKRDHYQRISVPKSYLHVDDFPTIEDLVRELHRLNQNDSAYGEYLQWTQLYDVGTSYSPSAIRGVYPSLCFLGHYQRLHEMSEKTEQVRYLLRLIRDLFAIVQHKLPNYNWQKARSSIVKISEFYNPQVNCWDDEFPSFIRRAWNYLFTWWKLF